MKRSETQGLEDVQVGAPKIRVLVVATKQVIVPAMRGDDVSWAKDAAMYKNGIC